MEFIIEYGYSVRIGTRCLRVESATKVDDSEIIDLANTVNNCEVGTIDRKLVSACLDRCPTLSAGIEKLTFN